MLASGKEGLQGLEGERKFWKELGAKKRKKNCNLSMRLLPNNRVGKLGRVKNE